MPWIARQGRHLLYLITFSFLVKPVFLRTCPQCSHMMGRHQRRRDGSFQD